MAFLNNETHTHATTLFLHRLALVLGVEKHVVNLIWRDDVVLCSLLGLLGMLHRHFMINRLAKLDVSPYLRDDCQ